MKVVFLPAAERDLGEAVSYIQNELQNPIAARNIATKILQRSHSLSTFPEIGAGLDGIDGRLSGYRYLLADNYIILYRITGPEIVIVRILFGRSDYVQLLRG